MKIRTNMVVEQTAPAAFQQIGRDWGVKPELLANAGEYIWLIVYDEQEAVGLVGTFPQHPCKKSGLVIEYMIWNPNETARRKLEAAVTLLRSVPASLGVGCIGYSFSEDFRFFKLLQKHGCIRKIGKQRTGFNKPVTAWETPATLLP